MAEKCIFESSTALADIRIERCNDELQLKFNTDSEAIQSAINIEHPHQLVMQNLQYLMGILLFIPEPKNILLLGVGGGSLVHFFRHYLPQCHINAVEYNPELLDIAFRHLHLPKASERLDYIIDDARSFLEQDTGVYDLIVVDIFEGNLSPPWLQQETFIQQIKTRLSSQGAVSFNLLINDKKTFKDFYRIFRTLFQQQTLCLEAEEYENLLVYGLNFSAPAKTMSLNLQLGWQLSQQYDLPFTQVLSAIYDINPVDSGVI